MSNFIPGLNPNIAKGGSTVINGLGTQKVYSS